MRVKSKAFTNRVRLSRLQTCLLHITSFWQAIQALPFYQRPIIRKCKLHYLTKGSLASLTTALVVRLLANYFPLSAQGIKRKQ